MSDWNFDIAAAPRTCRIIVATKDGTVTISRWLAKTSRWEMLATDEQPVAWMPWPKHPTSPDAEAKPITQERAA